MTGRVADDYSGGLGRFVLPLAALAGLVVVALGLVVLSDRAGGTNLLASIYDLTGNREGAAALRRGIGDTVLAKFLLAGVALAVGVGGIWLLYTGVSATVALLRPSWQGRLMPWVFTLPALALLAIYLIYPTIATITTALTEDGGAARNFGALLEPDMVTILRNNVLWLIFATGGSVLLGLVIAGLVDRVKREALAKTFIFLPLAISLVGASVIWGFVYDANSASQPQTGLLNAVAVGLGAEPIRWLQTPVMNTFALIAIMIWLQTGFAMVVLSAAIKGVSVEVVEAAKLDGASERQLFFGIIVPIIKGSIITVATTIAIAVLKIFDIVYVMTGGRAQSDVVANRMFQEMFQFFNDGRAAALATVLFVAVLPVMYINLRNLRQQGIGA